VEEGREGGGQAESVGAKMGVGEGGVVGEGERGRKKEQKGR